MNSRNWSLSLSQYHILVKGLLNLGFVKIIGFPMSIIKIFQNEIVNKIVPQKTVNTEELVKVDPKIRACLFPFQIEGVKFMIGKNGRCLLADDMGLGKTIQSLGAASYYRSEWPLLVICPSSVKLAWRDQMLKWLTEPLNISVINTSRDISDVAGEMDVNRVVLISYDLVTKLTVKLMKMNFRVIIMDESHFIKEFKSSRSKSCVPLLKKAKRVFLLSGTPALSRPSEMFTQIDSIMPTLYNGYFAEFGNRYCDPKTTQWGTSYLGSTNITELQVLLEENIMLRRIKSDVLTQLPEKLREVIILAPQFLKKAAIKRQTEIDFHNKLNSGNRHGELLKYFHETGKAKIDAIKNYIDDLIESPKKTLFFAHHSEVLNAVEDQLIKKKVGYIRIDGSVNAVQKRERAEKFQCDESVQIAVLSIMAAGTGINLTSATLVVFGELFWNPGILLQAENRCHRIGQKDLVNVHYLVAENTADDYIWPLVQRKLELLSKVGLNKENFKNSETTRLEESFSEKNDKKPTLIDYFERDFIEDSQPPIEEDNCCDLATTTKTEDQSFFSENMDWMMEDFDEEDKVEKIEKEEKIEEEENFDWLINDEWPDSDIVVSL